MGTVSSSPSRTGTRAAAAPRGERGADGVPGGGAARELRADLRHRLPLLLPVGAFCE